MEEENPAIKALAYRYFIDAAANEISKYLEKYGGDMQEILEDLAEEVKEIMESTG